METVLIIGANRGIGLALAKLHAQRGDRVLAFCRTPSGELEATGARVIGSVDVRDDASVASAVQQLGEEAPTRVLVVAGVLAREGLEALGPAAFDSIRHQFEVNAMAPLRVVHALLPRLRPGAKLGLLTSRMGSVADNGSGGYYGYRMSKAALNAAGKSLALDLRERGVTVLLLHPGFVQTDMTEGQGDTTPEQSAANLMARMDAARPEDSGSFLHADGTALPW